MIHRGRARQRGVALLLVLWVFMILGVLALDFSRYMRDDAMASVNLAEETRGYYLAIAGMQQALYYHMLNAREPADASCLDVGSEPGHSTDMSLAFRCTTPRTTLVSLGMVSLGALVDRSAALPTCTNTEGMPGVGSVLGRSAATLVSARAARSR